VLLQVARVSALGVGVVYGSVKLGILKVTDIRVWLRDMIENVGWFIDFPLVRMKTGPPVTLLLELFLYCCSSACYSVHFPGYD
jgi:hypothetical protein